jgi:dolichol kinase
MLRRINISAALIVLICFFLPWEQVSCGGAKDTLSGLDLARHDQTALWVVPLLMLAVLIVGFVRRQKAKRAELGIVSLISGAGSAYLMNDQRTRVHDAAGFISAQLTGWFWLAFISSLALIIGGIALLLNRQKGP